MYVRQYFSYYNTRLNDNQTFIEKAGDASVKIFLYVAYRIYDIGTLGLGTVAPDYYQMGIDMYKDRRS